MDDYNRISDELMLRIKMVYNSGNNIVSMSLVYWCAIAVAFITVFLNENFMQSSEMCWTFPVISLLFVFLCGIPGFFVVPSAVKYHDGIRQIISLCAYQKVFYEFETVFEKSDDKLYWETIHCNPQIPNARLIGLEYFLVSLFGLVFIILSEMILFLYSISLKCSLIVTVCCFVLELAYTCICYFFAVRIVYRHTDTKKISIIYIKSYLEQYLAIAKKLNKISQEKIDFYLLGLKELQSMDADLSEKLKG